MSDYVIQANGLSKAYRLGLKDAKNDTLGATLASWVKSPAKNYNRLRKLSRFDPTKDDEEDMFWALRDMSFSVAQGEILGIIGRNGAGKSTLLKILSKITDPTLGEIRIKGRVAALLEVGTGFNLELTGRENIFLNGTILGMTRKEVTKKFDEIVDFSGVEKFIDTPVKRYSSGMKVRLGFAVAAHLEPEILIIDEVLAVGDAEFQKKCLGKMQGISAVEGRTVLFVSHDMSAVGTLCNKCLLLERGRIDMVGETPMAIQKYTQNVSGSSIEDYHESTIRLQIEEVTPTQLVAKAFFKILENNLLDGVFHLRLYDGANFELMFYKEKDIRIYDNEYVEIKMDVSSFKAGYYSIQVKYAASTIDLSKRVVLASDFTPVMVDRDTFKYEKGSIAPPVQLINTTRNFQY